MKSITLPLTNVYAKGDYSATLYLGSQKKPVNLVADTGSSTLVVKPGSYQVETDSAVKATSIVQEVNYGIGGWAGALMHTEVRTSQAQVDAWVKDTAVAVVESDPTDMFAHADGILGLAFEHLNKSFELESFFSEYKIHPPLSFPWPFEIGDSTDSTENTEAKTPPEFANLRAFKSFLWQYPEQDLRPFFTQVEEQHLVANKFGFYAKRSSIHVAEAGLDITTDAPSCFADDPLNKGSLILGGGEEQTHLYQGEFQSIKVLNDIYYNVNLIAVQVAGFEPIDAEPLAEKDQMSYYTNAIIDTGSSLTLMPQALFSKVVEQLTQINAKFGKLISPFSSIEQQNKGIDASDLNLAEWPDIDFIFEGETGGRVTLTCRPDNYWQLNTPVKGNACFKIFGQLPNWPNQSIIGLPLLTNYFVVFDRDASGTGVVKFAKQK